MLSSSMKTKPRLVATVGEKRTASRTRISNVIRSRRAKKSRFKTLAAQNSAITPKATRAGTRLNSLSFTASSKAKRPEQHKIALALEESFRLADYRLYPGNTCGAITHIREEDQQAKH